MNIWEQMQSSLDAMETADLIRRPAVMESACGPVITVGGRQLLCFCSNDYLGLADDQQVKDAAIGAIRKWGVGAGASRLICGTSQAHVELERQLAQFKGTQDALVTSTGYMANLAAIHALAGAGDMILCDKLNHASIIDAAMSSSARVRTYPHGDVARLAAILARHRTEYRRCLIVTDSLFSMDGDIAPLGEIVRLKTEFDSQLLIDEAHATGVFGEGGRGVAEHMGLENQIDVTVGTLSKAIGGLGGFIAGPRVLIDTIRNTGRSYIYTTALPAALCEAAIESLRIIQDQPHRREHLLKLAERLRNRLKDSGLKTGNSCSQIIPVMVGSAGEAVKASRLLLDAGFLVPAIRPPTVPRGQSRLRVSLCAKHLEKDVDALAWAIVRICPRG